MSRITLALDQGGNKFEKAISISSEGNVQAEQQFEPQLNTNTVLDFKNESQGWSWSYGISAEGQWNEDVTGQIKLAFEEWTLAKNAYLPKFHGVMEQMEINEHPLSGDYRGPGQLARRLPEDQRLALPMVVLENDENDLWLLGLDPGFSANVDVFRGDNGMVEVAFSWKWVSQAGIHSNEKKRIFAKQCTSLSDTLNRWFECATPEVAPGPAWIHEIKLSNYDFLSKNGEGWFRDIDKFCELIPEGERKDVVVNLHGWYDEVGNYCFDHEGQRFKKEWEAFSYINHPQVLAKQTERERNKLLPDHYFRDSFRNLEKYKPVPLSWESLRERLQYAKSRGFRTAFYAMTGLQTAGNKEDHLHDGTALDMDFPTWIGPELVGDSFILNPLKPAVRDFFTRYMSQLLEQVGDLVDVMVMDEAYYIPYGMLGPAACPGYADRAQMTLIKELTDLCHSYRSDLAFMTADNLGLPWLEDRAYPYSLNADGIYTDVMCWPISWDVFRFPAWRNVAWSCNWQPYSNFKWTKWGVIAHDAPISMTNGCFGDDMGIADMDEETISEILELWRIKQQRTKAKRLVVEQVERRS